MNNQNQNQNQNINTNINTKEYKKNLRLQMKNLRIEFHKNQNDLYNQKTQIILDKVKNFICSIHRNFFLHTDFSYCRKKRSDLLFSFKR